MNFTEIYSVLPVGKNDSRFIGMNTGEGFVPERDCFPPEKKLRRKYIIKGAPGTGKSTVMKKIADYYERKSHHVRRLLCSSDPDSLDAITVDGVVQIVDGTSPHLMDMNYPGCSSELICLSNFWSRDCLVSNRDIIETLTDNKKELFSRAYRMLSGVDKMNRELLRYGSSAFCMEKARKAANRIADGLRSKDGTVERAVIRSFGMKGARKLDVFQNSCEKYYYVSDEYNSSILFMNLLSETLIERKVGHIICPDPLKGGTITDIYIPDERILFSVDPTDNIEKTINTQRFIDKSEIRKVRGAMRLCRKCLIEFRTQAELMLREAADVHFRLEKIYGSAMNYESLNEYTKLLINDIGLFLK